MTEKNLDDLAVALAQLRIYVEDVKANRTPEGPLTEAFDALDNAGIFAEIDQHTNYEPAQDTLSRSRSAGQPRKDPAEWGDLSGYSDQPRHSMMG